MYECSFSFGGKRMALPATTSHKPSPGRRQKSSSVRARGSSLVAIMSFILTQRPVFITVSVPRIRGMRIDDAAPRRLHFAFEPSQDLRQALAALEVREEERAFPTHTP